MAMKPTIPSAPRTTAPRTAIPKVAPAAKAASPKFLVPQSAKAPVPPAPRKRAPIGDKLFEKTLHTIKKISPRADKKRESPLAKDGATSPKKVGQSNFIFSKSFVKNAASWKDKAFGTTRKKIHKSLAEDPGFLKTKHATPDNLKRMKEGKAPLAPSTERLGQRKTMELDHKWERQDGVKENRVDNLRLVSPLTHKMKTMRKFHKAAGTEMPKDLRDTKKFKKPGIEPISSAQKLKKPFKLF